MNESNIEKIYSVFFFFAQMFASVGVLEFFFFIFFLVFFVICIFISTSLIIGVDSSISLSSLELVKC